eukprot:m51a1_g2688 putative acyl- -binding protein (88) ;mRNA; f:754540-754970
MEADFERAASEVRNLKSKPTNNELLSLYSLFKQGTEGDCNAPKPWMVDITGCAKWNAWNGLKGKSKQDAMKEYIGVVADLKTKYGTN